MGWTDDFNYALEFARQNGCAALVLFTGSDWCHWCKVLKKNVLEKGEFKRFAERNLVLIFVDSPRRRSGMPRDLLDANVALGERYGVRGYPHTLIMTASGKVLGEISGYSDDYLPQVRDALRRGGYRIR